MNGMDPFIKSVVVIMKNSVKPDCIQLINEMVNKKYISVRKHTEYDLYIYNYTKQASAEHIWNEATEICRGLILDGDMNIVARPFAKFYNYEELVAQNIQVPDLPFDVYEKLDGSLGILYFVNDKPFIATRGSFNSEQAIHATNILYFKYADKFELLDKSKTYLFEIIIPHGPDSNLVVDYGDIDDIYLLAVIDTKTGVESDIDEYNGIFNLAQHYDNVTDYLKFRDGSNGNNREGFIIKFSNGFRMKLKFSEYLKAHFAKSSLNYKRVLDSIKNGSIESLRKNVEENLSEESVIFLDQLVNDLQSAYFKVEAECAAQFRNDFNSRKEMASYFMKCKYPQILFAMVDNKNYSNLVWNVVNSEFNH